MMKDLTKGSPMKLILSFGIPVLLGYLFQQLYSVVDTAIVGKTLGGAALAAVGSTGSVNFLVVGFCCGICGGMAIPVAQQFGAGNDRDLRKYMTNGVWLCVIIGVLLTLSTVVFCRNILTAMHTPEDIYERAYLYIVTIFAGLPAYFLYNFAAGILRSLGDSRTPVIWLIVASVVNVVLDILFILAFHMDVFGAALATVLAQGLAGVGCLIRILRGYPILKTQRADWRWDGRKVKNLCLMGLPMGFQYSITAIGCVMIQAAVNDLGTVYVTAVTAAGKVSGFLCCPFDAMGSTMATYGGQHVGAGKLERLNQGLRACILLGLGYSLIALVVTWLFADPLNMLFLDAESAALLPLARQNLLICVAFYFPLALVNIIRFLIQGMGFPPLATLAGLFEMAARGGLAMLVPMFGYTAACFANPAAWVLADLFLIPAYFHCYKVLKLRHPSDPLEQEEPQVQVQVQAQAG
ncbi:MAG: MATE family efflux transporter [Oscillospiraceae bacterium]|nr:MATE family efflux transporter [Oscillospiraceae bacterium]